jgi:hypothetical protein
LRDLNNSTYKVEYSRSLVERAPFSGDTQVLPISIQPGTFKRDFLGGHGSLNLNWAGFDPTKPFSDDVTTVDSGSVTGSTGDLTFGQATGLQMTASLSATSSSTIELIRDPTKSDFAKRYKLNISTNQIGCHFHLEGQAGGTLSGSVPLPAMANLDFGIKAGASVFYDRFSLYDAKEPSGNVLLDLVTGLRLPEHAGLPATLPVPGELLVFGYDGYLDMNAGLSWGYQLTGHEGITYNELNASIEYALQLKAAANFAYKLAAVSKYPRAPDPNQGGSTSRSRSPRAMSLTLLSGFKRAARFRFQICRKALTSFCRLYWAPTQSTRSISFRKCAVIQTSTS